MRFFKFVGDKLKLWKSGSLLSPWDWMYLLSLLLPFVLYTLSLKALLIFSRPNKPAPYAGLGLMEVDSAPQSGFLDRLGLMQSDLLFSLGYVLLWVGLFAVVRSAFLRGIVVVLFHVMTLFITLLTTATFQYYNITGLTLDPNYFLQWIASPEGTGELIASGITGSILLMIVIAVSYILVGAPLLTHFVSHWRGWSDIRGRSLPSTPLRRGRIVGTWLSVAILLWASLMPGGSSGGFNKAFSRNAFVDLIAASVDAIKSEELPSIVGNQIGSGAPAKASLQRSAATRRRNVVLVFFESTRATATTPYNKALQTTPFLNELAAQSLLTDQAYAVVGHTHNALTAAICSIDPPLDPAGTAVLSVRNSLPAICLPHLLKKQGYSTGFFMSHTKAYEDSESILKNLGYETFYSVEYMETAGFERTYYWGYEDEIMLEPSARWLQENRDTPFLATYLTSAPHHDYQAPQKRHGRVEFTKDDLLNRYLNAVRNQDFFLRTLFDQYKRLGLYDDTIFIIMGDHGEAFGEHGIYGHNMIYEEGIRIPLLIHDPERFRDGSRVTAPVSQLDILPTVADLLGYKIRGAEYKGHSLLRPLPDERTLMFGCWGEEGCLASLKGTTKYIYHFDAQPEQLFDLATDPAERKNLASGQLSEELDARRTELLEWHRQVRSQYISTAMGNHD